MSLTQIMVIINSLGCAGLALIFWWVDHRRFSQIREEDNRRFETITADYKNEISRILMQYKDDMAKMTRFYENNIDLVKHYERLADDLSGIIHLNTRAMTELVEKIRNNMFCPIVREKGPNR
ncbi:MAG: hypothetical protein ABIK15_07235 [Pseudomonadota bacterium]